MAFVDEADGTWWRKLPGVVTMVDMCHRFQAKLRMKALVEAFSLPPQPDLPFPTSDRFPGSDVVAIRADADGQRELSLLNWGLLPSWWKPSPRSKTRQAFQRNTFNARSETIHEKPSFRTAFKKRRCLIPITAFYEGGHFFGLEDQEIFALAGLWESWHWGEERLETCTVVTTEANSLVAKFHARKRMPVILDDEESFSRWLDPGAKDRDALTDLFRPFDEQLMTYVPESDTVS